MELHYSKHHKGHVEKYNTLSWLAEQAFLNKDYQKYIGYLDSIEFNYHGHLNHQFFWENLSPNYLRGGYGGNLAYIDPSLEHLINDSFESFHQFLDEFK